MTCQEQEGLLLEDVINQLKASEDWSEVYAGVGRGYICNRKQGQKASPWEANQTGKEEGGKASAEACADMLKRKFTLLKNL